LDKNMNCDWTEKISLLMDGELAADEAREVERHVADCSACRHAQADFMMLRQQLGDYHTEPNLIAQRQALKNILGVGDATSGVTRDATRVRAMGWRERASRWFALPRLSPALVGALAVVIVALVVGVVMLRKSGRVELASGEKPSSQKNVDAGVAPSPSSESPRVTASPEVKIAEAAPGKVESMKANDAVKDAERRRSEGTEVAVVQNVSGKSRRVAASNASGLREQEASRARIIDRVKLPVVPKLAVDPTELVETQLASLSTKIEASDYGTSRHVEQAQVLLRSFRNARAGGEVSAADVAYQKRRASELLFRNIVLRREAESKGNVAVASLLDNLEPILLDIAHLPDRPAKDDVRSISERMKKKNIVAMLQVANASRMY
jgi:anti-sigma factor RsiW